MLIPIPSHNTCYALHNYYFLHDLFLTVAYIFKMMDAEVEKV